jgi:hypothetical protein
VISINQHLSTTVSSTAAFATSLVSLDTAGILVALAERIG